MAQRVHLHVGTPKSGTTYLQSGLWSHRDALAERGVLVPGRRPFDHNRASIAVRSGAHLGEGTVPRHWTQLCSRVRAHDGVAVLSNEWFLRADEEQARGAVDQLGGDAVEVVITTRSLVRIVPAAWQESLKVGRGHSLEEFVADLERAQGKWIWAALDPAEVAERWARVVGAGRVHVVTTPQAPPHPGLLWDRFLGLLGLPEGAVPVPPSSVNESLGVQAARLLQEYGPALRAEVDEVDSSWRGHSRWLRQAVVRQVLVGVPGDPIGVGAELEARLGERTERSVEALRALGVHVVGDLDELLGGTDRAGARRPDEVTADELVDVGRHLAAGLLRARIHDAGAASEDTAEPEDDDEPESPTTSATTSAAPASRTPGERTRRWTFFVPSAYAAGGIARTVFTTANTLVARGHEARVVTLARSSAEPKFDLDPRVELVALQDRYDPEAPDKPRPATRNDPRADPHARALDAQPSELSPGARKTFSAWVDELLRRELEGSRPGVVVTTRPEFAVAASRWAHPDSILLHQEHLSFVPRPEQLRKTLRDVATGADGVRPLDALLALTDADHDRWVEYVGDDRVRTGVIPNPTPFEVGEPAPLTRQVVVAAGRFTAQKGFERLVEAWLPLVHTHPEWQLRIFGDGPQWEAVQAQVDAADVGGRIVLGGVTRELERELAESSLYAMSSRYEGLPMVLLEAMSKGVPPVSFDCPEGPRQLIDDGRNGLLVPEGDVAALTAGLTRLMDDHDLRRAMGRESLETARDYQSETVVERWISLAEEVDAARS